MNLGAEPKKVAILGGLLALAGLVLYFNVFSGDTPAPTPSRPVAAPVAAAPVVVMQQAPASGTAAGLPGTQRKRSGKTGTVTEFKIRQGAAPGAEKPDPATIDPTLRLDLLAKLQTIEAPASIRNIFQYGAAPPPPAPVKPIEIPKNVPKIATGPPPPVHLGPPPPPPVPTAPPMTFKYYGYLVSKLNGHKEAFLLDGDEIIMAEENEAVKRGRYKVVRIDLRSITIEDTQFKSTQTLQLADDAVV